MNDQIIIRQLKVDTRIGVYDWERECAQTLCLDITLDCNTQNPAKSDDLNDAIDYSAIADAVRSVCARRHFNLLESLAEELSVSILSGFKVAACELHIRKPGAVSGAQAAEIKTRRIA